MTSLESIYEIQSAVLDLQRHLKNKSPVVSHRVQEEYVKWVDRFFRENIGVIDSEQRITCLHDFDYFLNLLEETAEYYYLHQDDNDLCKNTNTELTDL